MTLSINSRAHSLLALYLASFYVVEAMAEQLLGVFSVYMSMPISVSSLFGLLELVAEFSRSIGTSTNARELEDSS